MNEITVALIDTGNNHISYHKTERFIIKYDSFQMYPCYTNARQIKINKPALMKITLKIFKHFEKKLLTKECAIHGKI